MTARSRIPRAGGSPLRRAAATLFDRRRIPCAGPSQLERRLRARLAAGAGPRKTLSLAATIAVLGSLVVIWPANAATPQLTTQASASGFPAGVSIFDVATLGLGDNPTGTITFDLYGPDNATCAGDPIFTSDVTVNGNANYQSESYPTNRAGTYQWVASYSGDANNDAVNTPCDVASERVVVAKKVPVLSSDASDPVNGQITNTATLTSGAGPAGPIGTITFSLYGPDNLICAGDPIFVSTATVAGEGEYTSEPFTPTETGTYRWVVVYSGDDDNFAAGTICADPAGAVIVTEVGLVTPTIATMASPTIPLGGQVTDTATLAGGTAPMGEIVFRLYGPNDPGCSATPAYVSAAVPVNGNADYTSAPFVPTEAGLYRWRAFYSGDALNNATSGPCNAMNESVVVTGPGTTTTSSTSTTSPATTTTAPATTTTTPGSTSTTASGGTTTTMSGNTTTTAGGGSTTTTSSTTTTTRPPTEAGTTTSVTTARPVATTTTVARIPSVQATPSQSVAGQQIVLSGAGFVADERLTAIFNSDPVLLATVNANVAGAFSVTARIPADATVGGHTIVVTGASGRSASTPFTVLSPQAARAQVATPASPLARTGMSVRDLLSLGAILLVLGNLGVLGSRRRRLS